jgi:tetratricopeptide (TPR) repeat protein
VGPTQKSDMSQKTFLTIVAILFALACVPPVNAAPQCRVEQGQLFITEGRYDRAVREFTCIIDQAPTEVEGYRGRIEAELLLGQYSNAVRDYARLTAFAEPVHPDARNIIVGGYTSRLASATDEIPALTGLSFAHWWFFEYATAIQVLNDLLDVEPDNVYAYLFRGSSRMLAGTKVKGAVDFEVAIALEPLSPDVRFIVSDGYTYGQPNPARALLEASLALLWGLDTPRIHAILATAYNRLGDEATAATHSERHFELVTTQLLPAPSILVGDLLQLDVIPGRSYEIPVPINAGEKVTIGTSSHDFTDTILVLLAPDGTPVLGRDDDRAYFAGFTWIADDAGLYKLWVTSFESVSTGTLLVNRK